MFWGLASICETACATISPIPELLTPCVHSSGVCTWPRRARAGEKRVEGSQATLHLALRVPEPVFAFCRWYANATSSSRSRTLGLRSSGLGDLWLKSFKNLMLQQSTIVTSTTLRTALHTELRLGLSLTCHTCALMPIRRNSPSSMLVRWSSRFRAILTALTDAVTSATVSSSFAHWHLAPTRNALSYVRRDAGRGSSLGGDPRRELLPGAALRGCRLAASREAAAAQWRRDRVFQVPFSPDGRGDFCSRAPCRRREHGDAPSPSSGGASDDAAPRRRCRRGARGRGAAARRRRGPAGIEAQQGSEGCPGANGADGGAASRGPGSQPRSPPASCPGAITDLTAPE